MLRAAAAFLLLSLAAAPALAAADGQQVFNAQCKMCHGGSGIGPSLAGVVGSKVGEGAFAFSSALKAKGGVWTEARIDTFLKSPSAFAPGTKMPISVANPEARKAVVGYLKTLK
ncbi:MAG TPA: c-type cytochrome [Phenylobacterium sp.]